MPKKRIEIDLAQLEELAASGLSGPQAAEALGVKYNTLAGKIQRLAEFKDAWKRGVARRGVAPDERTDEDKVLDAIRAGQRTAADIKRHSGLKNGLFMNAVEKLEVALQIKARDEHMLTHYYLAGEDFPLIEKPADVPPPPVSTAIVSSPRHAAALEHAAPQMKNVTPPQSNGNGARPAPKLEVLGRAVLPLEERVDLDDALRGLQVERSYMEYHGAPSPTMSAVLSKVESTLQEIKREVAS